MGSSDKNKVRINKTQARKRKQMKNYKEGYEFSIDGACGWNCMVDILWALGFQVEWVFENKDMTVYTLRARN